MSRHDIMDSNLGGLQIVGQVMMVGIFQPLL